jgi:transcriptional regulator with XRE-family HTH domain
LSFILEILVKRTPARPVAAAAPAKENAREGKGEDKASRSRAVEKGIGDEVGAADLARRVADNLRSKRKARGLSLDDLARASGVSRAALSQIETCKTNPTVGVLWKIATGLAVPFAELLDATPQPFAVLRRHEAQVLRSPDGKFESRPLVPAGATPLVELYELKLAPRSAHAAEPHAPGTREIIVVLTGQVRMRVGDDVVDLQAGDSMAFEADKAHSYENPGPTDARCHNVIRYER